MKEYKIERIIAELQNMAQNEILNLISAGQYNRIKSFDEHPEFRVYTIGVEGEARGKLLSRGEIGTQHWFKSAIRKIADKVKEGVQFFNLHAKGTNSTAGRTPIGEVVGKGLKSIGDKLNALVVAYIYPEFRKEKLDVASIETNVSLSIDNGVAKVDDVEDITGIALGNSAVVSPGFAGATLQGAFQAFEAELQNSGKGVTMTKEEILAAIKEANLNPTSLFGEEILKDDVTVKSLIKTAVTGEYEHRKRTDKAFDDARADWEKEKKEITDKNKTLEVEKTKLQVGDVLATNIAERKLDDKQKIYVTNRLPQFNITDPEKVKDEIDKFVDNQLTAYEKDVEIITGKKKEEAKKDEPKKDADVDAEVSDENLDPEKNDMIPETHKKEG